MTTYVAKESLPVGGVLAYTRGQRVEAAALDDHPEWRDLVVGENTKEARAIHAEITGQPVDEPQTTSRAAAKSEKQEG